MKLFKRHPYLLWHPRIGEEIISQKIQETYSIFASDFVFLEERLMGYFREIDNLALKAQNDFWKEQLIFIVGGALATILGALQATFTSFTWLGICEGLLAAVLTVFTIQSKKHKAQQEYFTHRLKAEKLRSEYFQFLGRIDQYTDDKDRYKNLISCVADIVEKEKN